MCHCSCSQFSHPNSIIPTQHQYLHPVFWHWSCHSLPLPKLPQQPSSMTPLTTCSRAGIALNTPQPPTPIREDVTVHIATLPLPTNTTSLRWSMHRRSSFSSEDYQILHIKKLMLNTSITLPAILSLNNGKWPMISAGSMSPELLHRFEHHVCGYLVNKDGREVLCSIPFLRLWFISDDFKF